MMKKQKTKNCGVRKQNKAKNVKEIENREIIFINFFSFPLLFYVYSI